MSDKKMDYRELDSFTRELFDELFASVTAGSGVPREKIDEMQNNLKELKQTRLTQPILDFFLQLLELLIELSHQRLLSGELFKQAM